MGEQDYDRCPHCGRLIYFTAFDAHTAACGEGLSVFGFIGVTLFAIALFLAIGVAKYGWAPTAPMVAPCAAQSPKGEAH